MIVKAGNQIFNSDNMPVIALFTSEELQQIANLSAGNDVLFAYPNNISKKEAYEIAKKMRDEVVVHQQISDQKKQQATGQAVSNQASQTATETPAKQEDTPKENSVKNSDDEILKMVGGKKSEENTEKDLTRVKDEDILAMAESEKQTKENKQKHSDAVLHATFDVASAEDNTDKEKKES